MKQQQKTKSKTHAKQTKLSRKKLTVLIIAGVVILGGAVYGGTYYLANNYLESSKAKDTNEPIDCHGGTHKAHTVVIQDGKLTVPETHATVCDTLTITNNDDEVRLMAFGVHSHHQAYDGVTEQTLNKGESLTITLDQEGTYIFHDHYHDEVQGEFVVGK